MTAKIWNQQNTQTIFFGKTLEDPAYIVVISGINTSVKLKKMKVVVVVVVVVAVDVVFVFVVVV